MICITSLIMAIEVADDISPGHEFVDAPDEIGVPQQNELHAVGHAGDAQPPESVLVQDGVELLDLARLAGELDELALRGRDVPDRFFYRRPEFRWRRRWRRRRLDAAPGRRRHGHTAAFLTRALPAPHRLGRRRRRSLVLL